MKLTANSQMGSRFGKTLIAGNFIDGKEISGKSTFTTKNPSEHEDIVGHFPQSTPQDVLHACKAAQKAFVSWKKVPAPVRASLIERIGQNVKHNKEHLAQMIMREVGKSRKEALGEVQEAIDTCNFFLSEGRRLYGQTVPSELPNKELMTYRRPLGVCGLITAGNFPVAVPSWKIIPALLCGNTVVFKPASDASACGYLFAKMILEAGVPQGVFNVVFGNVGSSLVSMTEQKLVQKISFTGSTPTGKKIGEICGRNLIIPSLELGGKNPLVVMEDANLELAVEGAVWASFGTAGQRCTSCGNIIVHKAVAKKFTDLFLKRVSQIKIGNPCLYPDVDYGPFMSEKFFLDWQKHYEHARKDGAKLLYGNGRITKTSKPKNFLGDPSRGYFGWPTVWGNVQSHMWIAQNEIFGPTINIIEVKDFDEAIKVANDHPYGLSSAIYTNNRMYAYRFKTEIEAGMTSINNSTTGAEAHLPFGGVRDSGNGTRESGVWVLEAYTKWQAVNDELSGKLQLAQMDVDYGKEFKEKTDYSMLFK